MAEPGVREGSGKLVLLVDDERPLLRMMSAFLARLGYEARTAESTDGAWELAGPAAADFAAAVLDASMPGMRMEDLASRLLAANPSLRVVVASGYPVDMSLLEAAAPGRVLFLHKPFTSEMLAATLRRLIGAQEKNV